MKKWSVGGILVLACLGGCAPTSEFMRGFRDKAGEAVVDAGIEYLDKKYEGKFNEITAGLKDVKESIPEDDLPKDGLLYTLGGLAAYIIGSYGKGKLRERASKGKTA